MEHLLNESKVCFHQDRIEKWKKGERFSPLTIDMALTQSCNYNCIYCFGKFQKNKGYVLTFKILKNFLDDCRELGVKAISLVSDGESTLNPSYKWFIQYAKLHSIDVALASHGANFSKSDLLLTMPYLTYLRFNVSAGEKKRYSEIHGVKENCFDIVVNNIKDAVSIKKEKKLNINLGMQMVLMPDIKDQIIPLSKLAIECGVDYLDLKHCTDTENKDLGVDYSKYESLFETLKEAENMSTEKTKIIPRWNKIKDGNIRSYSRCYGTPFHLQISGSGLIAPCGSFFNDKYKQFHLGNFAETRFKDIINSDKYWQVMDYLASDKFDAKTECACLCLQHNTNKILDDYKKGLNNLEELKKERPFNVNFI